MVAKRAAIELTQAVGLKAVGTGAAVIHRLKPTQRTMHNILVGIGNLTALHRDRRHRRFSEFVQFGDGFMAHFIPANLPLDQ